MTTRVFVAVVAVAATFAMSADGAPHRMGHGFLLPPQARVTAASTQISRSVMETRPRPSADNCVASPAFCNTTTVGKLGVGDCTISDGTFVDLFTIPQQVGNIIDVVMWPTSTTMTNPSVMVLPPQTDASKTPMIFGGKAAEVSYVISSNGNWGIAAGTHDLFALGSYSITPMCYADDAPEMPQNCIYQILNCGQTAAWYLTNQSCRFSSDATRVYADFVLYGVAGDYVQLELSSSDFTPLFGVYDSNGNEVVVSAPATSTKDVANVALPKNDTYEIVVTSKSSNGVGFFTLSMKCASPGCVTPTFLQKPTGKTVPYGTTTTLTANAAVLGDVRYDWFDVSYMPTQVATGQSFTTPPVKSRQTYKVRAVTPCGTATSDIIIVDPQPSRQRVVRH